MLITVDTLRADRLGAYGYTGGTSPHIDELARQGVLFLDVSTPLPRTTQAFASLFTSQPPSEHGVEEIGERLGPSALTLAEILSAAGYRTAAVSANGVAGPLQGLDQGFAVFVDQRDLMQHYSIRRFLHGEKTPGTGWAEAVTREALRWLEGQEDAPFFLWLLYFDPHHPYGPPPPYNQVIDWSDFDFYERAAQSPLPRANVYYDLDGSSAAARPQMSRLYDAEIRYTDAMIGRLLQALRARPDFDRTLIAFTADHGESLGEHGYYYEHGDLLYQPTLRIPWILHWPTALPAGVCVEGPASLLDVTPTLLSLLGIRAPAGARFAGRDLSRDAHGGAAIPKDRVLLAESGSALLPQNPLRAIGGRRRLRIGHDEPFRYAREQPWEIVEESGHTRLYDTSRDPFLSRDLADRFPEIAQDMARRLDAIPVAGDRWRSARDARFKLIRIPELSGVRFELYDLLDDPFEEHDLATQHPDEVRRLSEPLEAWVRASYAGPEGPPPGQTAEEQREVDERLRSLGYIE